ncbi:rod shape-determining protein MreC [Desulfuromonas acetoxidans]|uniref:Cell shape-determining protein MreC n=1 Tax=Desulfuromonas acetoxidans (strain DSM 684 / 11070) TaxID=281689 RepID=Q1JVG7_DESA6|nr:rod shape-determining protein MreC [Desulfuromonas acetoxidans]EAT14230.1 rod shape-determining protein MreC [Desulfuromonas acetoxidans DSM 684]MBF0645866.1 rod shape-determining protein MreC [Desulfuromonas acetoxidans]NVD25046.1 rod shape-determining protein MreC [Desulfuromonas acetoxidans]NVE17091.1 rod shape-determining protein MreC [Desulfuromonas acetoxidans]
MRDFLKRYQTALLFCLLLLCALLLYSNSLRQREHTSLFEKAILQLASPFYRAIDAVSRDTAALWNNYIDLIHVREENIALKEQLRQEQGHLAHLREIELENQRLKQLLGFLENTELPAIPARVIAVDASSWFRTITIDKGTDNGLDEGMPVVVAEGIVGRTIKCAAHTSRVLLVIDASSEVAVLVQHNRTRGIARGQGAQLTLEYALRSHDVALGDTVVTSGTGGVFPKGLPVGTISNIVKHDYGLFQTLELTPSVDFARLEDVLILTGETP